MVVTGRRAMRQLGVLGRVEQSLQSAGVTLSVFEGVSANPRTDEVDQAVRLAREGAVEVVIGLGGGSALDAAKAVAACRALDAPASDLLVQGTPIVRTLPLIAVPTTAGTGSELSRGAILTDPSRRFKGGLRGDGLFPVAALVDPDLSLTMPPALARLTGFDVFCHAVETYFSRLSQPALRCWSLQAVAAFRDCLFRPRPGWSVRERATGMSYASSLMGINLGNASTCLPHRLQYAVGALTDTAHPAGLAALYPDWFERVVVAAPGEARVLLETLFVDAGEAAQAAAAPAAAMIGVLEGLGIRTTLQDLGIRDRAQVEWCIGQVTGAGDVDPCWRGPETVGEIFLSAYGRGC